VNAAETSARTGGTGERLYSLVAAFDGHLRSITGKGVRATLAGVREALGDDVPFEVHEVPSGTPVLDWTVPKEWNVGRGLARRAGWRPGRRRRRQSPAPARLQRAGAGPDEPG
jgi:aminopeptidase-like protein